MIHPIEWVGTVIAKPALIKPRTVDPIYYGVGNLKPYKRSTKLRKEILTSVTAIKDKFAELERNAHKIVPRLTPEKVHQAAKEIFVGMGKSATDTLSYSEFQIGMKRLGFFLVGPQAETVVRAWRHG